MRLLALLIAVPFFAGAAPRLTYTKVFKGAQPEFWRVELNPDGSAVYKESENDEQPVPFSIAPESAAEIFGIVSRLDNGKRALESNLKVANMGQKTILYEDGPERHEVTFNYSLDKDAQALADRFERISETQQYIFALERTVRFDKLGVNKVLLQIESAHDRNRLLGHERMIPLLERVAKNGSYLNMARERAEKLIAAFKATPTSESSSKQ
jgi:hypothetical protein